MKILLVVIFFLLAIFMMTTKETGAPSNKKMLAISILMIVVAALRPDTVRDYGEYKDAFLTGWDNGHFEAGFVTLTSFIRKLTSTPWVYFFCIAAISVGFKVYSIKNLQPYFYAAVLVYFSTIYILQDLVAIRAGLASGLGLLALYYKTKNSWKAFIGLIFLGSLFHTSSFLFLPLWFIRYSKVTTTCCTIGIIFSYILAIYGFTLGQFVTLLNWEYVQRLWTYYSLQDDGSINIFSVKHLLNVSMCLYLLYKTEDIRIYRPNAPVFIYIYSLSVILFLLFSDVQVISVRISELYQVCQIICIPYILYVFQNSKRPLGYMIITVFCFCQLYLSVFYSNLVS